MNWIAKTLPEVASFFGVKPGTISKDWRAAGMPGEDGHYDLSVIAQWKNARLKKELVQARADSSELEEQKLFEEVRYKKLKNDEKEKLLVRLDEVQQEAASIMQRVADRVQAIPDAIEMELPSEVRAEVKRRVTELINLVLKEMSQWEP